MFFAGMTGDAHPIHYDDEYAKKHRFGRRLAHGLLLTAMTALGASTLAPLVEDSIIAFVEQTTRFLGPAFVGDTITRRTRSSAWSESAPRISSPLRVTLTNQRGETILDSQHRYLIAYRPR
jgi:acyl dehydratase